MTELTETAALAAWCHSPEEWAEWVAAAEAAGVEVPDFGARLTAGVTQITSMEGLFKGCATYVEVDVSNWDLSRVSRLTADGRILPPLADNGGSND